MKLKLFILLIIGKYLLHVVVTRNDVYGYYGITPENETQIHLYSNNIERKIGSHDLSYGQV